MSSRPFAPTQFAPAPQTQQPAKPSRSLRLRRWALGKHGWLGLIGGLGLFIFGLSGLLHIVMTTWGPQQAVMMPPQAPMDLSSARSVKSILTSAGIAEAAAVKIVASDGRSLLQVTPTLLAERRYFDLKTGEEIAGGDERQAVFLARHYLKTDAPVAHVQRLTEFTPDYPWVNRLLPVYRVDFDTSDDRSIYVFTETNASAGVTNDFKRIVQTGFRWLHTWSWVPQDAEWVRVLLIAGFVGTLLALVVTGVLMLIIIRRKVKARGNRQWHRVAGYALALPLLLFTSSGLYHLLSFAGDEPGLTLSLAERIDVAAVDFPLSQNWQALTQDLPVNALSVVVKPGGGFLYRLGLAQPKPMEPGTPAQMRTARFDGATLTGPAVYLDAETGAPFAGGDKAVALALAAKAVGSSIAPEKAEVVTRFGQLYDFRNKRLPVWQFSYGAPLEKTIWVDTATGALVDQVAHSALPERWSFSILHKWNFLRAFRGSLGRHGQNIIIATVVLASVGMMGGIGLVMYTQRRKRRA